MDYKIGIGITTHNRYEVFKHTYDEISKYLPDNAKLVVIDDASTVPVPEATYRFDNNVGIATAKNKCFELLDDCDHIFLFDDDCYPKIKDWWQPYVNNPEPHLMYIFTDSSGIYKELHRDNYIVAYSHPRGCMLYFDNICLETVGGMDIGYGKWGYEHVDLSNRIFNVGLTSFKFSDVVNSSHIIHSIDEHNGTKSSIPKNTQNSYIIKKLSYYESNKQSTKYIKYRLS